MKQISVLVPAAIVVVMGAAMVLAAPQSSGQGDTVAKAPDRAAAYQLAVAG